MTAPRERRDASVPVRIASDVYWRLHHAATRDGFDDVQAYAHIAIEAYLATWKPARRARVPV